MMQMLKMKHPTGIRQRELWSVALLMGVVLLPAAAHATLGEPVASVAADGETLKAQAGETADEGTYRVSQMRTSSGTLVSEYSTPGGTVFAVTWRGPRVPDLKQMLGKYYDAYTAAAKSAPHDRRQLEVRSGDLVVHLSGHMRAFVGRAYLASATPTGVSAEELP